MDRNQIFKNFAIGFIPLFVFIAADELFGTEIGLIVAILTGLVYLAFYYTRHRRIEKMILFDTALIVVLGGASLGLHNDIFFKLKPALIEFILVILLGIHAFSSKPILIMMSKRYMGDMEIPEEQTHMMKNISRILFIVVSAHTALIVYSAYFWSKEAWAFVSGGLFYILFGVIFAGQWIYLRFFRNKSMPTVTSVNTAEEWFDLVNEKGEIMGRAPRSQVHGNPRLLHAVVHMHVFNKNGQIYLQKRSKSKDLYPEHWDTAVGGHIMSGESVEQALSREADEELGLKLQNVRPLFRYIMSNAHESEMIHAFRMIHNGPFRINHDEIEIGRFWSIFEIRKFIGEGVFTPNFEQEFQMLQKMKII